MTGADGSAAATPIRRRDECAMALQPLLEAFALSQSPPSHRASGKPHLGAPTLPWAQTQTVGVRCTDQPGHVGPGTKRANLPPAVIGSSAALDARTSRT